MKKRQFRIVDGVAVSLILAGGAGTWYYVDSTRGTSELDDNLQSQAQSVEQEWDTATNNTVNEDGDKQGDFERGETVGVLKIPAWGDDHAVPIVEGTSDAELLKGVGRYESTVLPGEIGNLALAAHRSGDPQPFRDLLNLQVDDEIKVEMKDATYIYKVTSPATETTVWDNESWVLYRPKVDDAENKATITLTTCTQYYLTPERSVLFGELKQVVEK